MSAIIWIFRVLCELAWIGFLISNPVGWIFLLAILLTDDPVEKLIFPLWVYGDEY